MRKHDYLLQLNSINERHRNADGEQFRFAIRNSRSSNYVYSDETLVIPPFNKNELEFDEDE